MRQALLAGGPPIAVFFALWFYVRAENKAAGQGSRRRIALFASAVFLLIPLLSPSVFDAGKHREVQGFVAGVCAACSLGLALAALRTVPSRKVAPLIMILLSGAIVSLSFFEFAAQRF